MKLSIPCLTSNPVVVFALAIMLLSLGCGPDERRARSKPKADVGVVDAGDDAADAAGDDAPAVDSGDDAAWTDACIGESCAQPRCDDGVKNGDETDIDCGGVACAPCTVASCSDNVLNGSESDVDCGGPDCAACLPGSRCGSVNDCTSKLCINSLCALSRLAVTLDGAGSGTVTSSPAGIDCGATCIGEYAHATSVTLTASPAPGSRFTGWSGACTGTAACTVSMSEGRSVVASFSLERTLDVSQAGSGQGTVASTPAGIDCPTSCSAAFDHGAQVALSASPGATSNFTGWSGACIGLANCVVSMTEARTLVANFALKSYTLSVSKAGSGIGTVTSSPSGISCGATCSRDYAHGTQVVLTAVPSANSNFIGWSGAGCTGVGTCSVTITQAESVTALFYAPFLPTDFESESFDNLSISAASYTAGSFVGDANRTWHFEDVRRTGATSGSIDGNGMVFRGNSTSGGVPYLSRLYSPPMSGGIGGFSVEMRKAFEGSGVRQIELVINGTSVATSVAFGDFSGEETIVRKFEVPNVNIAGNVVIELRAVGVGQLVLDNLVWTQSP
ncbi:MAG: hypothetical protein H0U74_19935 [Bradymonadaceae bacterium]|nr:hypothetical protein [Lujinxingiaceae bacterium]